MRSLTELLSTSAICCRAASRSAGMRAETVEERFSMGILGSTGKKTPATDAKAGAGMNGQVWPEEVIHLRSSSVASLDGRPDIGSQIGFGDGAGCCLFQAQGHGKTRLAMAVGNLSQVDWLGPGCFGHDHKLIRETRDEGAHVHADKIAGRYHKSNSSAYLVQGKAACYAIPMDARQAREVNFAALLKLYKNNRVFADAAGLVPAHVSQLKNRVRAMGDEIARRIEKKLRLPHGWMDQPHDDGASPAAAIIPPARQPLGTVEARAWMDVIQALTPRQRETALDRLRDQAAENDEIASYIGGQPPTPAKTIWTPTTTSAPPASSAVENENSFTYERRTQDDLSRSPEDDRRH